MKCQKRNEIGAKRKKKVGGIRKNGNQPTDMSEGKLICGGHSRVQHRASLQNQTIPCCSAKELKLPKKVTLGPTGNGKNSWIGYDKNYGETKPARELDGTLACHQASQLEEQLQYLSTKGLKECRKQLQQLLQGSQSEVTGP